LTPSIPPCRHLTVHDTSITIKHIDFIGIISSPNLPAPITPAVRPVVVIQQAAAGAAAVAGAIPVVGPSRLAFLTDARIKPVVVLGPIGIQLAASAAAARAIPVVVLGPIGIQPIAAGAAAAAGAFPVVRPGRVANSTYTSINVSISVINKPVMVLGPIGIQLTASAAVAGAIPVVVFDRAGPP